MTTLSRLPGFSTAASKRRLVVVVEAQPNQTSGTPHRSIQRAVAFIEINFASSLSRKEMARAAGMSVSYFSNLFHRGLGLSPHRYLVHCRLRHARKLLSRLDKEVSIVAVACESGFADQAHFSRHFRRAYGVSPLAFRRTIKKSTNVQ